MKTITSQMFRLHLRDVLKAFLIAVLTPVIPIIQNSISAGQLTFNWDNILIAALGGAFAYLVKNFLTPAQIIITGEEVTKAIEEQKTKTS